jgi:hypothetical protein
VDDQVRSGEVRRQLVGGYRRDDVDAVVGRLRRENGQLAAAVEERWLRLQALQQEVASLRVEAAALRDRPTQAPAPVEPPVDPAAAAAAPAELEQLARQVEDLRGVKAELLAEVRALVSRFAQLADSAEADAPPAARPEPSAERTVTRPLPLPPVPLETGNGNGDGDGRVYVDRVDIDAGPFVDFSTLSAFERAVARLPEVDDVYVRRFASDRALIELHLRERSPLVNRLQSAVPGVLQVTAAEEGRISVDVVELNGTSA